MDGDPAVDSRAGESGRRLPGRIIRRSGPPRKPGSRAGNVLRPLAGLAAALAAAAGPRSPRAEQPPLPFRVSLYAAGLTAPTAMAFAPDGRLFVCEQEGRVRVIRGGTLLPDPFVSVRTRPEGERGLLGVTLDPDFEIRPFVYVYYTVPGRPARNRVSRFTAAGDTAAPESERVILELDPLGAALDHNGGALHFGPDGMLYVATGDGGRPRASQSLRSRFGKILRIRPDGSIPPDNPFPDAAGRGRAIWALGLRNPFTMAFHPVNGRLYINDVGASSWEEVNEGAPGANYGWPITEGPTADPRFRSPLHAYPHGEDLACAVTGGVFYEPAAPRYPPEFRGRYFFADFCGGWIRTYDPDSGAVEPFAAGVSLPVDLDVGPDGRLYFLSNGTGAVGRIEFDPESPPAITAQPEHATAAAGETAAFRIGASGAPPLTYRWLRDGEAIPGADRDHYTTPPVGPGDNGARFRCLTANAFGATMSRDAVLSVVAGTPPLGTITAPAAGQRYRAGQRIEFAGEGTDREDGSLAPGALTWRVDFHHDLHVHPFLAPFSGARRGSFFVPLRGEPSPSVWYRIHLAARDSSGLVHRSFVDVPPRTARLTLATSPPGLQVTLDGRPGPARTVTAVAGSRREVGAPTPQVLGDRVYRFRAWSDRRPATHTIAVPERDAALTAFFAVNPPAAPATVTAVSLGGREVEVRWTPGSGDAARYRVERRHAGVPYAEIGVPGGGESRYLDGGLRPDTVYTYRVRAENEGGFSAYSPAATVRTPPDGAGPAGQP